MPVVSIVLPCYNHGAYVEDAIRSVLNQTYTDFELFVFDNGSTDDSWLKINRIDDPRMKKFRLDKNNLLEVKQYFIEKSSGKYCAIMHSDDVWMPEKLEKQVRFLEENSEARVCFTWSKYVDENLNEIPGKENFFRAYNKSQKEWWDAFYARGNHISCPSFICEKDIYIRYFGRLYPYRQIADYYCWLKILCKTNLYIVEEFLVKQRVHWFGKNMNESAETVDNSLRSEIELKHIEYRIINEMEDEVFVKNFVDETEIKKKYTHMDVLCWKILYFIKKGRKTERYRSYAVRFYEEYFVHESDGIPFYVYLSRNFGFSREDFFEYESGANFTKHMLRTRLKNWAQLANTDFSTLSYPRFLSIYGCGQIGKTLLKNIKSYCTVQQFIDKAPQKASYNGIPVKTPDNALYGQTEMIVVTPSYDFESIEASIRKCCKEELNIVKIEDFLNTGEKLEKNF